MLGLAGGALVGNHQRHRTGGRREVDVFGRLTQRSQFSHHIDGHEARTLECLQQPITPVHQLFDLLAGQFAATSQLAEHTLAIRTGLVDHLATLLLGHDELGFGVGRRILASTCRLDFGFFAQTLGLVGGLAEHPRRGVLGANLDLRRRLACRLQDACGLFAEHSGDDFLVERHDRIGGATLRRAQLAFEELFALLQAGHLGSDHPQQIPHLGLVVPAS